MKILHISELKVGGNEQQMIYCIPELENYVKMSFLELRIQY
jgi:hypothetical protein